MNRIVLILIAILAIVGVSAAFVVTETEYAIKFQLGRIVKADYEPGLHFKVPFINNVRKFDRRILTLDTAAEKMITDGELMNPEQAAEIGLVDELADSPEDVVAGALEWCEAHLSLPRAAMLATRSMARGHLHEIFEHYDEARGDRFIDIWFSGSTQDRLRGLVANLKKKR